ncbi:monooxygenase [Asanoa ishikariensis]|uniref:Salicylate hydroxylase n=1 Tax=Asanoa ishikariensis TaxID=137265 RepID=A0A1H3UFN2_9ACTN|nr:FAD-dependent monooxygenase [Asanoa ishikariensis]GIF63659.1 monooxygenase [Asanoa ishikariensis]SDZ61087.1 salicylate hydroxylase [Asanoa ishikariensis]
MAVRVAVVGGGIGGLVAGLALRRAGLDVRVFEQAPAVGTVGAGIQLAPNATRALAALGVLPAVRAVAVEPTAFEFRRWDDGRVLSSTPLGAPVESAYGAPYLHVHRGDLVAVLASAVQAAAVPVEVGVRCVDVLPGERDVELRLAGGRRERADLVVGADGIHSVVRRAILGTGDARFTGHVAFRGLIPASRVAGLPVGHTSTVRMGPGRHCVHYFVSAGRLLNVVCVIEEDTWTRESWTDHGDPAELRAAFADWDPVVRALVDALDAPLKWALFDRLPFPRWSKGPVTLLGDACHPMLPYGAQGAAQAIEDAAVLAACLRDAGADVPAALARYELLRHDRTARVQELSRGNATRFHLPDGPEQRARDAAIASTYGLSPDIDWLYGFDPLAPH